MVVVLIMVLWYVERNCRAILMVVVSLGVIHHMALSSHDTSREACSGKVTLHGG